MLDLHSLREGHEHLPRSIAGKLRNLARVPSDGDAQQHTWQCCRSRGAPQMAVPARHSPAGPVTAGTPCKAALQSSIAKQLVTPPLAARQCMPAPAQCARHTCSSELVSPAAHAHVCCTAQRGGREMAPCSTGLAECRQACQHITCRQHEPQTLVVDQIAQWRNRKETGLPSRPGQQRFRASRQVAFMLMVQRHSRGHRDAQRFFDLTGRTEFRIGRVHSNYGAGFAVADSPEQALELTPRQALSDAGVVVVKGIANGLGYLAGGLMHVPTFRPVCVMEQVITGTQQLTMV